MASRTAGQIEEIGGHIEEVAGAKIKEKVMEGSEKIAVSKDMKKVALWVKDAMDRLDAATTPEKCRQIMAGCGHNCCELHIGTVKAVAGRRQKFATEEAFLQAEVKKPAKGTRLELHGDHLIQYYTPHNFSTPMRCYCGLMRQLPEGVKVSPTYCQCSRGFIEKQWQSVLGREVRVEVIETAISGADECKFIIHL